MEDVSGCGSSPLARGLRGGFSGFCVVVGIIPARAGFTASVSRARVSLWDHPRSRGVYRRRLRRRPRPEGSSPLARGLQETPVRPGGEPRIIPARAGFTTGNAGGSRPWTDHPRSRGVYARTCRASQSDEGSSPLARGLRGSISAPGEADGIIPARAGFTDHEHVRSLDTGDHPRSRGVYPADEAPVGSRVGSSPLARGLQDRLRPAGRSTRKVIQGRS